MTRAAALTPPAGRPAFERVCLACRRCRPMIEYCGARRTCNDCMAARLRGATPVGPAGTPRYTPYDGAELRPFAARPGALDAYALPSVLLGQRTPRKAGGRP